MLDTALKAAGGAPQPKLLAQLDAAVASTSLCARLIGLQSPQLVEVPQLAASLSCVFGAGRQALLAQLAAVSCTPCTPQRRRQQPQP